MLMEIAEPFPLSIDIMDYQKYDNSIQLNFKIDIECVGDKLNLSFNKWLYQDDWDSFIVALRKEQSASLKDILGNIFFELVEEKQKYKLYIYHSMECYNPSRIINIDRIKISNDLSIDNAFMIRDKLINICL